MKEYAYSYISDTDNERIGYIQATSLHDAQLKLTIIKHLSVSAIDRLFKITEITNYEKRDWENSN